jgi:hypothetical protein
MAIELRFAGVSVCNVKIIHCQEFNFILNIVNQSLRLIVVQCYKNHIQTRGIRRFPVFPFSNDSFIAMSKQISAEDTRLTRFRRWNYILI